MKITWLHIGVGAFCLYAISSGNEMSTRAERAASRREQRNDVSAFVRRSDDRTRDAQKLNRIALDRYLRNCQLVVDKRTGQEVIHSANTVFVDRETGFTFPEGTEICNKRGWTAVTNEYGQAVEIAQVTRFDSDENGIADVDDVKRMFYGKE